MQFFIGFISGMIFIIASVLLVVHAASKDEDKEEKKQRYIIKSLNKKL